VEERVEKKIDLLLEKLTRIEALLSIDEDLPGEDEVEAIRVYLEKKRRGKLELVRLEEVIDDL